MKFRTPPLAAGCLGVIACSMLSAAPPLPLLARDALAGKWKATLTADDTAKESTDNLTFKGGQFTSENGTGDGFDPATYADDPGPQGIGAKFSVTLTNKAGDTAKWTGLSTGSEMDGTLVVTKKDGTSKSYSFKATKQ